INPISVISPYLSITSEYQEKERRKILNSSIKFATIALITCLFIGGMVLDIFGISTFSLKIAGGILFFKFGYDTINGQKLMKDDSQENPGLVPLGFPIIAGPGSITAIILLSTQLSFQIELAISLISSILIIMVLTFLVLRQSTQIIRVLGAEATKAIVKIMGLLIITLGIQLILTGINDWMLINA
ncbi:MAG: MarC family protein, partial [Candidatus Heimdallarchaeota archaeon]|nr:MarC family protein [Candidatus Heimdallarchaeota archaeon]